MNHQFRNPEILVASGPIDEGFEGIEWAVTRKAIHQNFLEVR